ncbi:uncharacterized protein LOC142336387 isoform X2 [Convolutriloba macropyga]|uniref:uncharacterized protein LOC142336387 isoform X2 n=1 Tax=Convolutriloba macropyga TaxID=536237 RepID=UPI003F52098F
MNTIVTSSTNNPSDKVTSGDSVSEDTEDTNSIASSRGQESSTPFSACFSMPSNSGNSSSGSGAGSGSGGVGVRRRSSLGHQSGCEALHDSVAKGKLHLAKFILDALDRSREVVDFQDEHGKTALIRSCKIREMRTQMRMAELLLERGASVNLKDHVGKTVLHYACEQHSNNLVKLLIKKSANPNLPDNDGCTPLILCARAGNDIGTEILVKCFRRLGLNVDHEDSEGLTALMTACRDGYLECARILIHIGKASVDKRDKYSNRAAAEWARWGGCSEEEISLCLKKPSPCPEDMEFPEPRQVLQILCRQNQQRHNQMRKQKSELYIPELDMGYLSHDENNESNGFGYQRLGIGGRPGGLRSISPRRRNSNVDFPSSARSLDHSRSPEPSSDASEQNPISTTMSSLVVEGMTGRESVKSNSTTVTTSDDTTCLIK